MSSELSRESTDFNVGIRPVENNAVIVTSSYSESCVILQMPRGNLEAIHPRPLILALVEHKVKELDYLSAAQIMRENRLNFNLLFDLAPSQFFAHIEKFCQSLSQCKTTVGDLLTLFITDLCNDDLTLTMYSHFFDRRAQPKLRHLHESKFKTNQVCDAMIAPLSKNVETYGIPLLTCFARKMPHQIDRALMLLREQKEMGNETFWNAGLKHLQYLCSAVQLYKLALGTYDLNLAKLLAERTNIDPKEYAPVLSKFEQLIFLGPADAAGDDKNSQELSEHQLAYQKAQIDLYLERWNEALKHLVDSGLERFNEAKDLIKLRDLHQLAFEIYDKRGWKEQLWIIADMWAQHLIANQRLASAGHVHLRARQWASAANVFVSTNQGAEWCEAVLAARSEPADSRQHISDNEAKLQAIKMITKLESIKQFHLALSVARDVQRDDKNAVQIAVRGGLWKDARVLIRSLTKIEDVLPLELSLKNTIVKVTNEMLDLLERRCQDFCSSLVRLKSIREKHCEKAHVEKIAILRGDIDSNG
ncbi:hypothetical protein Ciccas_001590 [Cichlidogyrus casuarinus]|uniref:Uncharacterized protein n=1 Tax=Cichlidogyrus casuarinus TaxID=1844966 RepID=A0ABD2QJK6_9PLAT